jgi:septal ring factor EnvC (AmiA/AmiB activator)
MFRAMSRSMDCKMLYGLGALGLITLAPLVCAPAAACPQTQVAEAEVAQPRAAPPQAELKFDWPVRGRIVYGCGIEDKERITIGARNGAEVRAAQSGVVAFAGELKHYGNVVLIEHEGGFVSAYYGDDVGDLRVKRHDSVQTGQAIATMRAPEGVMAELSFELRRGSEWIDPRPLMRTDEPPSENSGDSLSAK